MINSPFLWAGVGIAAGFIFGFAVGILYVFKHYLKVNDEPLEK